MSQQSGSTQSVHTPTRGSQPAVSGSQPKVKPGSPQDAAALRAQGDRRVLGRIYDRCHQVIVAACATYTLGDSGSPEFSSRVPPEFLAALTANESAGVLEAARFEPTVYRHLQAVATGQRTSYGSIHLYDLNREIAEMLQPKTAGFHARFLTEPFVEDHGPAIAKMHDDLLKELATSWGYTQIMGYHMIGRPATVRSLLDPAYHYRLAVDLLRDFSCRYHLDVGRNFEAMFRCWNSGAPLGATYDPHYVDNGLLRISLYRQIMAERQVAPAPAVKA